jgi:hypothetical protein
MGSSKRMFAVHCWLPDGEPLSLCFGPSHWFILCEVRVPHPRATPYSPSATHAPEPIHMVLLHPPPQAVQDLRPHQRVVGVHGVAAAGGGETGGGGYGCWRSWGVRVGGLGGVSGSCMGAVSGSMQPSNTARTLPALHYIVCNLPHIHVRLPCTADAHRPSQILTDLQRPPQILTDAQQTPIDPHRPPQMPSDAQRPPQALTDAQQTPHISSQTPTDPHPL